MPVVTNIIEQKRRPNRRNVHLDGGFAFGCNVNVVAKFRLRTGMNLTEEQLRAIQAGEVFQECFDKATGYLQSRLHSRLELHRKLMRREYDRPVVEAVIEKLTQLGYVDDARFAQAKAQSAAENKKHGRRRAMAELLKSGVKSDVANRALDQVYDSHDALAVARELAQKQIGRLKKLDRLVARRRLSGMLQRRGFSFDEIGPLLDEFLGAADETE
jgi:regulatory protein